MERVCEVSGFHIWLQMGRPNTHTLTQTERLVGILGRWPAHGPPHPPFPPFMQMQLLFQRRWLILDLRKKDIGKCTLEFWGSLSLLRTWESWGRDFENMRNFLHPCYVMVRWVHAYMGFWWVGSWLHHLSVHACEVKEMMGHPPFSYLKCFAPTFPSPHPTPINSILFLALPPSLTNFNHMPIPLHLTPLCPLLANFVNFFPTFIQLLFFYFNKDIFFNIF